MAVSSTIATIILITSTFSGKTARLPGTGMLTPYFYGKLTGNHREALQNFADITGFANSTTKNLRTDNNARFDAVLELDGAWRLIGGVAYDVRTNSRLLVQDFDNTRSLRRRRTTLCLSFREFAYL